MQPPFISVVVPTCGRIALLARCLDALCAQSLPAARFEVIVVDDSSSASAEVADCCARARNGGLRIRYLRDGGKARAAPDRTQAGASQGSRGPAAARNLGWQAARGVWVGFTDDDTIAQPDWLERACARFTKEEALEALAGRVQVPLPPSPSDYERDAARLQDAGFVTANCFCRRDLLACIGGFDERFRVAWREDTDLYFRICDAGARVLFAPEVVVLHPVRPAGWAVSLSQQRKILFDALLYKKHRWRYRHSVRRTPRWDYYLTTAALLGAVAAGLAGVPMLAWLALSVWLLSAASFLRRRLDGTSRAPRALAALVVTTVLIPPLAVFWRAVGAIRFRVVFV